MIRRAVPFAFGLLAVLVAAEPGPAAAQNAEASVQAWLDDIDASPEWSAYYRTLRSIPATGDVIITGLTFRQTEGPARAEFDTVVISGYSEPAGGGFGATHLTLDEGRISLPDLKVTIADATLDDVQLPAMEALAFDLTHIFTSIGRSYAYVASARLRNGRIGAVTVDQVQQGVESTVRYEELKVDRLVDGRLDAMSMGRMTMEAPTPEGLVSFSIDSADAQGMDLTAIHHVFDPAEYQGGVGDGEWRTIAELTTYHNMVVTAPGARVVVAGMTLEDYRLRQPPKPFSEFFDRVLSDPDNAERLMEEEGPEPLLNLLSAFAIGRFGFDDIAIEGTGLDRFNIGTVYFRDLSLEGLGEFGVGNVDVAVPNEGAVTLDRFAFGKLVAPSLATMLDAIHREQMGLPVDPLPLIPTLGFAELVGLAVDAGPMGSGSLGRWRLDLGGYVGPIPTAVVLGVTGIDVDLSAVNDRQAREMLSGLGYQRLKAEYGFDLGWNETDSTVVLKDLHVRIEDVGEIHADVELKGLTRAMLQDPAQLQLALGDLTFISATIRVADNSLMERVLQMQAEKLNVTPDQFREQIASALPLFLSMLQNASFQAKIAPALQAFLRTPGTLTITARPTTPVPFLQVLQTAETAPQRLPDILEVTISHE